MEFNKRRRIIAILFLILANMLIILNSCTTLPEQPITRLNDPIPNEVYHIEKEFKENIYNFTGNMTYRFFEGFKSNVIGLCFHGINYILLKKSWWKDADFLSKRALVMHELGHCACFLGHSEPNEDFTALCPKSIMNDTLPHPWCLKRKKEEYDIEFKERCKNKNPIRLINLRERLPH